MLPSIRIAVVLVVLTGCAGTNDESETASDNSSPAGSTALCPADIERFLAVVKSQDDAMIPEFTPPDDEEALDFNASASELIASFHAQCQKLFDVERQGAIWQRDSFWSRALAEHELPPFRFAALVRDVSLAIMRVRLEARLDLAQLVTRARQQVEQTVRLMDEIDQVAPDERTREATAQRTRSVIRLGRAVALLEFAELVRQVPPESAAVIRQYSRQLKPLLPSSIKDELLVELTRLAKAPDGNVESDGEVEPAGYETPGDEQ